MTPPVASGHYPAVFVWLSRDTYRQALASGVCWIMLAVSVLTACVCLTTNLTPGASLEKAARGQKGPLVPPPLPEGLAWLSQGTGSALGLSTGALAVPLPLTHTFYRLHVPDWTRVEVAGGLVRFDVSGDAARAVRTLQVHLASWVADTAGLLLVLVWTAGFLPAFLAPSAASVLLAKPVSRASLLLGKSFGVLLFVAAQAVIFLLLTWTALGLATGVWDRSYFVAAPLLLVNFAVFFSFSAMLAVATRSTVASVFGAVTFWLLSWAMNFGRHAARSIPDLGQPDLGRTVELGYWILPKPLDFHALLLESLDADNVFGRLVSLPVLIERGAWHPGWSVAASLTAAVVLFGIAVYEFSTADY